MAVSVGVKTRSSEKIVLPVDADRTMVVLAQEPAPPHITQTVGDITIGMTRPGGVGLYLQIFLKPKTKDRDGGSVKDPKPRGDIRPVVINRYICMTCIVRQE